MDYGLTSSEQELQESAAALAAEVFSARAAEIDSGGGFPEDLLAAAAEAGFLGLTVAPEYGGAGASSTALALVVEELAKGCASAAALMSQHNAMVAHPVNEFGTTDQKQRYLSRLAKGEILGAAGIIEPGAGLDGLNQTTEAARDGDEYVLNGAKSFVFGGKNAGLFLVFARTNMDAGNRGFSTFLIESGTPGLRLEQRPSGMGLRGAATCDLVMDQVRVPEQARIGEEGQGFKIALATMDLSRIGMAAQALGIAGLALQTATAWAISKYAFGKALADHQAVQWMLADSVTELEAARVLTRRAARIRDKGRPHSTEASMAKLAASRAAVQTADRCVQILGPEGNMSENTVERCYRDAKVTELYEGPSDLQRLVIVRHMIPEQHADQVQPTSFDLNDEQKMLRDTIRSYLNDEVVPMVDRYESESKFPLELVGRLWQELGLGGMLCSEQYGGQELDPISYNLIVEEMARVWPSLAIAVAVHNSVSVQLIDLHGTEEQKSKYLPKLTESWLGAFSLSEPAAGSDVAGLRATAVRDGDFYVLNGEKNWVTNGQHAQLFVIFAKTDPQAGNKGISAFLVERDTPGLTVTKPEKKMGLKSSETVSLVLEDMRVPASNLLGEEGGGFLIAMKELDGGRIGVGSQALGIAKGALEKALKYANERTAFGQTISKFQAIQWMLADMMIRLDAARLMVYNAAWLRANGMPHSREASMAKLYASESATFVTHKAIQIHGGYGYTEDYHVERFYRDARVTEIYEGTSEIQRLVIARNWLKENGYKPQR